MEAWGLGSVAGHLTNFPPGLLPVSFHRTAPMPFRAKQELSNGLQDGHIHILPCPVLQSK